MSVSSYNQSIAVFPASLIAGMIHCTPEKMFEISAVAREEADNIRISKIQ